MTDQEIRSLLVETCPVHFGTTDFAVPTLAYMQGPFYDYFQQKLFDFSLSKWSVDWECRDFVAAYRVFAQIALADTFGKAAGMNAIAVGEYWFMPSKSRNFPAGEGHAVNIMLTDKGLGWTDPQNGQPWVMLPEERQSAYFIRF